MTDLPFVFGANAPAPRKIAHPVKKNVSTEVRESIKDLISASAPRKFAEPTMKKISEERRKAIRQDFEAQAEADKEKHEAALAWTYSSYEAIQPVQTLESSVDHRRTKHRSELTTVLSTIVTLLYQNDQAAKAKVEAKQKQDLTAAPHVEDPLIHLDPEKLAHAWEVKVWRATYEDNWDLDGYVERMEQDLSDLDMWVRHWESELEGYEMFREHCYRYFGQELGELSVNDRFDTAAMGGGSFGDSNAVEFNFGAGPVAFASGDTRTVQFTGHGECSSDDIQMGD